LPYKSVFWRRSARNIEPHFRLTLGPSRSGKAAGVAAMQQVFYADTPGLEAATAGTV
jgi:hypothetical protein